MVRRIKTFIVKIESLQSLSPITTVLCSLTNRYKEFQYTFLTRMILPCHHKWCGIVDARYLKPMVLTSIRQLYDVAHIVSMSLRRRNDTLWLLGRFTSWLIVVIVIIESCKNVVITMIGNFYFKYTCWYGKMAGHFHLNYQHKKLSSFPTLSDHHLCVDEVISDIYGKLHANIQGRI